MTREESNELIDMLTIIKGQAIKSNNDTAIINIKIDSLNFVVDKAIKAIEEKLCEDCISRTEAMKPFLKPYEPENPEKWCSFEVKNYLSDLPSVQPKQRTGKWVESDIPYESYVCSECGGACWYYDCLAMVAKSRFCPNCGAMMDVSEPVPLIEQRFQK